MGIGYVIPDWHHDVLAMALCIDDELELVTVEDLTVEDLLLLTKLMGAGPVRDVGLRPSSTRCAATVRRSTTTSGSACSPR